MRQRTLISLALSLITVGAIGLAGVFFLGRASVPGWLTGGAQAGGVDAMFIEQMVPHHQDAIDMAELALSRGEHPEIRELAKRVKQNQSAENVQMRDWYREWFNAEVPNVADGGMMGPMMGGGTDLERLRSADDFDREFIEQMVPHHQMGIMMSRMAGRSTARAEMRRLTDSIIESQSREIQDMQRWYQEWYALSLQYEGK